MESPGLTGGSFRWPGFACRLHPCCARVRLVWRAFRNCVMVRSAMTLNGRNFQGRRFPHLSCLLLSFLSRGARDGICGDAALKALLRLRRSYTQAEIGAMVGTSAEVVRSWESGRRKLRGVAGMAVRMMEGIIQDWPTGRLPYDDWREKLWRYPLANIITWRKSEEKGKTDDYLDEFKKKTPAEQAMAIAALERWVAQLKGIVQANSPKKATVTAEVADRWSRKCRELAQCGSLADAASAALNLNGRTESDGSLTLYAPMLDGSEVSMRVESHEWRFSTDAEDSQQHE